MLISIDVGSTWTKGALFEIKKEQLIVLRKESTATTTENLSKCFKVVLDNLLESSPDKNIPVVCSSSAHGGLKITAIGIVPDLTVESAKLAALSAGGKLTKVYSYRLNRADVDEIVESNPDIVLLTGGTDGGNRSYILHNAQLLAKSDINCTILYGGNKDLQDDIKEILSEKDLIITSNVLPDLDTPSPEEAREAVRDIFLSKIIQGKGLQDIVDITGVSPIPTPAAIFDYVMNISDSSSLTEDFSLIDMGGATTDYYSVCRETEFENVIKKGIKEPLVKRSVEGDIGMRVSALSAIEIDDQAIKNELHKRGLDWDKFKKYILKINLKTDYIPHDNEEKCYDSFLAGYCTATSTERHGGSRREIYTTSGTSVLQTGRNLKNIRTVIGTGGYLAGLKENPFKDFPVPEINKKGEEILSPVKFDFYTDSEYIIPLLANASRLFPKEAAASFMSNLIIR